MVGLQGPGVEGLVPVGRAFKAHDMSVRNFYFVHDGNF